MKTLGLVRNAVAVFAMSCLLKCLTLNEKLYFSTDFQVHRNWLALTHSLPFAQWYKDSRNVWTLDYPPFFAYFEYGLSFVAKYFDSNMLNVNATNYESFNTIVFQRLSVILVSDGLLAIGTWMILPPGQRIKGLLLTLFSSSLFIVDHVHFQYNGMLLGLLLISAALVQRGRFYSGAVVYVTLIFFKHIFLYCAPVYFIYFLRHHVSSPKSPIGRIKRLFITACIVASISALALYPLYVTDQLYAALSRMFPFGRGLTHSYWAPNVWAVYSFLDRFLGFGFGVKASPGAISPTSGVVGMTDMLLLPNISPTFALFATIFAFLPLMLLIWKDRRRATPFITWVGLGCAVPFEFGWHIHEKAVLMILFPILIGKLVKGGPSGWKEWDLSVFACASLFPLLPRYYENPLKWVLFITCILLDSFILEIDISSRTGTILFAIIPECYRVIVHPLLFDASRHEFLPLMLSSVVCAVLLMKTILQLLYETFPRGRKPYRSHK